MAHINRSAKSGSDWTSNDLRAYNIIVSPQTPQQFYGHALRVEDLSNLDPYLLSGSVSTPGLSDETYRLLGHLDLTSKESPDQDSVDFARELLRVLRYESRGLLLLSRFTIPLLICGDANQSAQTDVCLGQGSSAILLVVQGAKTGMGDPEAQVIAEAIATFQYNNDARRRLGEAELDIMTIPCITMIDTRPIFYTVPVTKQLSDAVATAQYPSVPTDVRKCVVASASRRISEDMETPDYRHLALQHYTAFRTLAQSHWSAFAIKYQFKDDV